MIKEAIVKIVSKGDLTYEEAYTVMNEIMSGQTTPTQNAAFLAALSTKSARAETTDEIAGCAAAMRAHATKVETGMELFEIVGTGGDNAHSFNISTTSALVAAAGGVKVAMGILNSLEAVRCGVDTVQTTLGGLGGCPFAPGATGNTATEDFVYLLDREGYETGIDQKKLLAAAKLEVEKIPGNYSGHHIHINVEQKGF